MPRKSDLHPCACGCGETTNATWAKGHNQKLRAALEKALEDVGYPNGLLGLRELVEREVQRKSKIGRTRRADKELQEASKHLYYELWMLQETARSMATAPRWLKNAVLESFIIHLRNLTSFLYVPANYPSDVVAGDYFDDADVWLKVRPKCSPVLTEAKKRVGKEVAHLTYGRLTVTEEGKRWKFKKLLQDITEVVDMFRQHVPRGRLSAEWDR